MASNIYLNKQSLAKRVWKFRYMYLFILPAIVFYLIFSYYPMYGVVIAFKNYRYDLGILGSPWAGFKYFKQVFSYSYIWNILRNTVVISLLKLFVGFPMPILLALMLNEVRNKPFKKTIQTISYLPYFVSWVVVVTLMSKFFSPHMGLVNQIRAALFNAEPIFYFGSKTHFYPLIVFSDIWKSVGWGSIIYLAALTAINPELTEAAVIDGANRLRLTWHITLPSIRPTIGILFILSLGNLLKAGFEQIYLMQTPAVISIAEILETYTLKEGLFRGNYSYSTALGLLTSLVGFVLIITANSLSKKYTEVALW